LSRSQEHRESRLGNKLSHSQITATLLLPVHCRCPAPRRCSDQVCLPLRHTYCPTWDTPHNPLWPRRETRQPKGPKAPSYFLMQQLVVHWPTQGLFRHSMMVRRVCNSPTLTSNLDCQPSTCPSPSNTTCKGNPSHFRFCLPLTFRSCSRFAPCTYHSRPAIASDLPSASAALACHITRYLTCTYTYLPISVLFIISVTLYISPYPQEDPYAFLFGSHASTASRLTAVAY